MRELEFLPGWYPTLQRRKQAVIVQAWIAFAVVLCMTAGALAQRWQVHRQQLIVLQNAELAKQSSLQLFRLDELQNQQQQLQRQQQIVGELGINIDTTKLLGAIATAMPADMSLIELELATQGSSSDRRLNIHLQGIAPSDGDVASLLIKLNSVRFFDQVEMGYVRDRVQGGHVEREFEVSFAVQTVPVKGK